MQHDVDTTGKFEGKFVRLVKLQEDEQLRLKAIALLYELANAVCVLVERGGRGRPMVFERIDDMRADRVALQALEHFEEFTRYLKGIVDGGAGGSEGGS